MQTNLNGLRTMAACFACRRHRESYTQLIAMSTAWSKSPSGKKPQALELGVIQKRKKEKKEEKKYFYEGYWIKNVVFYKERICYSKSMRNIMVYVKEFKTPVHH